MPGSLHHRKGFTLIEMLIVGSLIVLFAGLAMIGAQQMYDDARRKAMLDECKSVGTGLSVARQDLGFFPRIHLLGLPLNLVRFPLTATTYYCRPAMDNYGYYGSGMPVSTLPNPIFKVNTGWRGNYMPVSEMRALNAGTRRSGMIRMRLSDAEYQGFPLVATEDISLVNWPTDTWGNPYVLYQITSDSKFIMAGMNPKGLRFISKPTEEGDYFTAVVSYGRNQTPGGNDSTAGFPNHALFVKGDMLGGTADFTLKSVTATDSRYKLDPQDVALMAEYAQSLENKLGGALGITDAGSDDIFFKF